LLALRQFPGIGLEESGRDHSTVSRAVRIGATTLEAKAGLRSIVRRDIKEGYQELLRQLGKGAGIESPSPSGQRVSWCKRI
jgi:hypothetical protein